MGRNEAQGWEVSVTDVQLTEKGKDVFEGKEVLVSFFLSFFLSFLPPTWFLTQASK